MTSMNTQAVINTMAQGMVTVLVVNVFASAFGMLAVGAGAAALPKGVKATQPGIKALIEAYGMGTTGKAIDQAGTDDIVALATAVEGMFLDEMIKEYGEAATDKAMSMCPPGDINCARETAAVLSGKDKVLEPQRKIDTIVQTSKKKAARVAKPVLDTKTKIVYHSRAEAGKAVAGEYGLPVHNFVWYEVIKKDPTRFVTAEGGTPVSTASASTPETKIAQMKRQLPEHSQVLAESGGHNPRKFIEKIEIIKCPAEFNPSAQGDYAYTTSFDWDGKKLIKGPSYSYDTMMNVVDSPFGRTVDVPKGHRIWITTYDGQWGGFWSVVNVYVHPDDFPGLKMLTAGR